MKITITIEMDKNDLEIKAKETERKPVNKASEYARFFDEGCFGWSKEPEMNRYFLRSVENNANARLKANGYLFLNDVYDMLGIPRTKAGQRIGWIYEEDNPVGDNYVDFGLNDSSSADFVNGRSNVVLLDFNVDGDILYRIGEGS